MGLSIGGGVPSDFSAPKPNNTSSPNNLKSGIESLSGVNLKDIKVHLDSKEPSKLDATAFTKGNDIKLKSGSDDMEGQRLLAFETTHLVQQSEGRVNPAKQDVL